jgi:hypothetical protein
VCENFTEFISGKTEHSNLFNDTNMFLTKSQMREVNDMFNKNEDEDQWENDSAVSESSDSTDDSS